MVFFKRRDERGHGGGGGGWEQRSLRPVNRPSLSSYKTLPLVDVVRVTWNEKTKAR